MSNQVENIQKWHNNLMAMNGETFNVMSKAAQTLSSVLVGYAKRQTDRTMETATKLSNTRSVDALVELQAAHLRETMKDLTAVSREAVELCMSATAQCSRHVAKGIPTPKE